MRYPAAKRREFGNVIIRTAATKQQGDQEVLQVTEAEVVYVGIDPNTPERKPRLLLP
jgi:hypothetical protein